MYDLNLDAETPVGLNDKHDHATVLQAVNKAIEYAASPEVLGLLGLTDEEIQEFIKEGDDG